MMTTKAWLKDTLERVAFTWVESFLGLLLIDSVDMFDDSFNLGVVEMAAASATISALAVVKAAIATRRQGLSPASFVSNTETE